MRAVPTPMQGWGVGRGVQADLGHTKPHHSTLSHQSERMTPKRDPKPGERNPGDKNRDDDRLEPQSIAGLTPEEALRGFMEVDPEKVEEPLAEEDAEGETDE